MKEKRDKLPGRVHMFWIYTGDLKSSLDGVTWLETTKHIRKMGWQVTLIAAGKHGKSDVRGVEVLGLPMPEIYLLGQLIFHISVIKHLHRQWQNINVVLFHEMSAIWLLPLRLFTMKRRNGTGPFFVMDTRTLFMHPQAKNTLKDRIRLLYYKFMARSANRFADGRLAITTEMATACNIPQVKLWGVWPSGVEPQSFIAAQSKRQWPIAEEPICLIYIGSLHFERNLLTLSRAVMSANQVEMRFRLLLVGEGTQRQELEAFAAQSKSAVEVYSPIPHQEVPGFLAKAHIGVLPFPDEEKFRVSSPIKLFEYMASGMPILATRIACHTNVVADGDFVFWAEQSNQVSLKAALEEVWRNRALLAAMGNEATAAVQFWTWFDAASKLGLSLSKGIERIRKPCEET